MTIITDDHDNGKCEVVEQGSKLSMKVPFFQVPNSIFDDEHDLKVWEIAVYCYLARAGNQGSVAFPSLETIGRKCGMSRRKAADAVNVLVNKGYLKKKTIIGIGCEYEIQYNNEPVQEVHGGSARGARVTSAGGAHKKEPSFKKNQEEGDAAPKPSLNGKDLSHLIGHYKDMMELYTDINIQFKDEEGAALKKLLAEYEADDIKQMITLMFKDTDPYWKQEGYPLLVFAKQIRKFAIRLGEQKKENKKQPGQKEFTGACDNCNTVIFKGDNHECYKPVEVTSGHDVRELTAMIGRSM